MTLLSNILIQKVKDFEHFSCSPFLLLFTSSITPKYAALFPVPR